MRMGVSSAVRFAALVACCLSPGLRSPAQVTNSAARLGPFVEFLHHASADPEPFLLKALAVHQVLILAEVHHLRATGASILPSCAISPSRNLVDSVTHPL